jgi:hypothetical protein
VADELFDVYSIGLTPATFIRIWQDSDNLEIVAMRLGIPAVLAESIAKQYRAEGVTLKAMPTLREN